MGVALSDHVAGEIEREPAAFANPARSQLNSDGYAPSGLRWLGASVPQLRSVVRKDAVVLKDAPAADVRAVAWWRRTALASAVALNRRTPGSSGGAPRTLRVCRALARDPHPLVAKAVSWALRSLVAHDPAAVRSFVEDHRAVLPSSVMREVRTKLATGRKNG